MIRATIVERYVKTENGIERSKVDHLIHETRYFSSMAKYKEWFNTFKHELWEDDITKVDLMQGIYVKTEKVELDNVDKPQKVKQYATFRNGISMKYAS